MRTIDIDGNVISDFDPEKGVLYETSIIRDGAIPPDGVEKMAYATEDFEVVQVFEPYTPDQLAFIEEQKRLQREREEQAAAAVASVEYFSALTSAFGGE